MSAPEPKVHIIGVGSDGLAGLTARARDMLTSADIVLGSEPTLQLVRELRAERVAVGPDLNEQVRLIETHLGRKRMVVVAGGDPLFYGVARYLCDRLGKDHFEVLPHVSSMQLAFARVKESWEEAYLTNLATHPLEEVLDRIRTAETVGLFTSEAGRPAAGRPGTAGARPGLFPRLCLRKPRRRRTSASPRANWPTSPDMEFAPLNVMILKRKPGRPDQRRRRAAFGGSAIPTTCSPRAGPRAG